MELEGGEKKPKKHKSKSRDKPTNKKSFRAKRPPSEAKVEDLDQFDLENPLSDDDIRETRRDKKRKSEKPVQEEVSKSKKKDKKKDKKKKAKKERPEVPQPMAKMPKKRKNSLDQALLQEMLKVSLQQAKKKEKQNKAQESSRNRSQRESSPRRIEKQRVSITQIFEGQQQVQQESIGKSIFSPLSNETSGSPHPIQMQNKLQDLSSSKENK